MFISHWKSIWALKRFFFVLMTVALEFFKRSETNQQHCFQSSYWWCPALIYILHPVTILQFTGSSKRKIWRCSSAVKIKGLWNCIFFADKLISCSRMCITKYKYIKWFLVFVVQLCWKSLTLAGLSQTYILKFPKSVIKSKEFLLCWKELVAIRKKSNYGWSERSSQAYLWGSKISPSRCHK